MKTGRKDTASYPTIITLRKGNIIFGTLILTILLTTLYLVSGTMYSSTTATKARDEYINEKSVIISGAAAAIRQELSFIAEDLLILCKYIETKLSDDGRITDLNEIDQMFTAVAAIAGHYDQIRFIDTSGMEQLRVNYNNGSPRAVEEANLENKSSRYYFRDSINLDRNQIYVSVLDLTIENGEIELPYKPMIRFATPVFSADETTIGILSLNYLAEKTFHLFKEIFAEIPRETEVMLVNSEGYYLIHDTRPDLAFGFMFPDLIHDEKAFIGNELLRQIKENDTGVLIDENTVQVFSRLYPLEEHWISSSDTLDSGSHLISPEQYYWTIITRTPLNIFEFTLIPDDSLRRFFFLIALLLFLGISLLISYLTELRHMNVHNIRSLAYFDMLTGMTKRERGMILLERLYLKSKKAEKNFALFYLDLDKFKSINDTLGHKAGDHCLRTVSLRIKSLIREEDVAIRIGGDEFIIILDNRNNVEDLWTIAERIVKETISPITFGTSTFTVGISIGIAIFPHDGATVEELISRADGAMYEAKKNATGIYPDRPSRKSEPMQS